MTENRNGTVVTFYSYKGGTGRTMALANVAWILAAGGKRVLVADWDLESPGLHRFFKPFIQPEEQRSAGGVVELVTQYERATRVDAPRAEQWQTEYARVSQYAFSLDWKHFPPGGSIDFLSAGNQNQNYSKSVYERDWDDFYENLGGGKLFDALREDMKKNYDYALIDSRTGISDVAGICTVHLPDVVVDCFTFSEQGIDGASRVAASIPLSSTRAIRILPVPMRVDSAEKERVDAGRMVARQRFGGLPAELSETERDAYWATVEVPYRPFYAFEETLATFGDRPGSPSSMLASYETLTRYITEGAVAGLRPMEEGLRIHTAARFVRQVARPEDKVLLRYVPSDRLWAEWVARVLEAADVTVQMAGSGAAADGDSNGDEPAGRQLTIVSAGNAATEAVRVSRDRSDPRTPLVVYVADVRPLRGHPTADSAFLSGQNEPAAISRLLKLVRHTTTDLEHREIGIRFPGNAASVFNAPIRNQHFTGREDDLLKLREQLQDAGTSVVVSALQGMGGIGKTQVAMEYAHRFRNAYDAVWWINASEAAFIDTQLSELGKKLGLPGEGGIADQARAVLRTLERGHEVGRWLVIFDNAEEVESIGSYLPEAGGHVVITSRNPQWTDRGQTIQVEVFERRESISHLRQRVASIRSEQAGRVAELLGDLPIAIAAAGAWLAETGTPVEDYLRDIEQQGPAGIRSGPDNPSVEKTWDLSLSRLQESSTAAYRLLQLCSLLAPEIGLDLVYGDRMADMLRPLDPAVSENSYRGALVQKVSRLALLKLDVANRQLHIHRLLQHVVRKRMTEAEVAETRRQVHQVLAAARPRDDVDNPGTWPRFRMLWPHIEVAEAYDSDDEAVRRLFIDRVRYVWLTGGIDEARQIGERFIGFWNSLTARLPDDEKRRSLRRQMLHLQFNLGNIIRDQSRFAESRELNEAVLAEQRELLGDNHPHTLMTAGSLAADLRALGLYTEALAQDQRTYAAWLENFGEDHQRTLIALNNLASSYRLAGDFRSARNRDQTVFQRSAVVFGDKNPNTFNTAANLGRDLREAGDYQGSIKLLRDTAEGVAKALGDNTPRYYNVRTNLAVSMRSAGRAADAAPLLEEAYEQLNHILGPSSPDTLACRLSRAVNLLSTGEVESAASELDEVEKAYRNTLGRTHPNRLVCANNRAAAARAAHDLGTAYELAQFAGRHFDEGLGAEHPYTLAARMNLAILTAERGDPEEAYRVIEPLREPIIDQLGPDHPDTLRYEGNVLLLRRELYGCPPEEELTMIKRLIDALGDTHPAVIAMRERRFMHRTLDPHPF